MPDTPRDSADSGLGDEHITRAARVLLEELPPTDLTIETMGEAAAHEEWRKIAARMLEAAGAVGDVIPPSPDGDAILRWVRDELAIEERMNASKPGGIPFRLGRVTLLQNLLQKFARGVVLPVPPETK